MNKQEFIMNAIGSNGFTTGDTTAGVINPTYWNRQLLRYLEPRLVIADKAKVYDDILGQDGASFKVTIDATPTAASSVAESDDITVSEYETMTSVEFTPTEYAKAYQLHDKQARRGFIDAMQNMMQKLGFSLALNRDNTAESLLRTGAGNAIVANGVDSSALASSDTIGYDDVVDAVKELRKDLFVARYLFIGPDGFSQLAKDQNFKFVNHAGTDETLRDGRIGEIYGLTVFETTQVEVDSNASKAIVLGTDQLGEPVFGIGRKLLPQMRTQSWALGRYTDIAAVEEWDMKMLRADGVCTIEHYA